MNEKQLIVAILQVLGRYRDVIRASNERVHALESRGAEVTVEAPRVDVQVPSVDAPDFGPIVEAIGSIGAADLSGIASAISDMEIPTTDIGPLVGAVEANTDALQNLATSFAERSEVSVRVVTEAREAADNAAMATNDGMASLAEFAAQQVSAMEALLGRISALEATTADLAAAAFATRTLVLDDDDKPIGVRIDRGELVN